MELVPTLVHHEIDLEARSMKRVLFSYLLDLYWERYASLKPSAHNHYASPLKHLRRLLGTCYFDEIVPSKMRWYRATRERERDKRTGQPIKGSTINREHSIVVHIYNSCIEWMREGSVPKFILPSVPPCFRVKKADERKYQRQVHLSRKDFDIFLSVASPKVKRICLYMILTARRSKEVRLLSEENINRVMGIIQGNQPKTDKPYRNDITPSVMRLISDTSIKMKFRDDFVNWRKEFIEVRTKAMTMGVPYFQPRDLRRTAAIHAYRISKDIRAVQELLGHSSSRTTEIYLNVPSSEMKRISDGLEGRFGEGPIPREWRVKADLKVV